MNTQRVLIISKKPLLREGWKMVIDETAAVTVTTAPNKEELTNLVAEFAPSITIVDQLDTEAIDLDQLFSHQDYPGKVILVGLNDDQMVIYSRERIQPATVENLNKAIVKG